MTEHKLAGQYLTKVKVINKAFEAIYTCIAFLCKNMQSFWVQNAARQSRMPQGYLFVLQD